MMHQQPNLKRELVKKTSHIHKLFITCVLATRRDAVVFCVPSGCVGRKPPHVQETQVEAGWSREASDALCHHKLTDVRRS